MHSKGISHFYKPTRFIILSNFCHETLLDSEPFFFWRGKGVGGCKMWKELKKYWFILNLNCVNRQTQMRIKIHEDVWMETIRSSSMAWRWYLMFQIHLTLDLLYAAFTGECCGFYKLLVWCCIYSKHQKHFSCDDSITDFLWRSRPRSPIQLL